MKSTRANIKRVALALVAFGLMAMVPTEHSDSEKGRNSSLENQSEVRPIVQVKSPSRTRAPQSFEIRNPRKVAASTLLTFLAISNGASGIKSKKHTLTQSN